MIIDVIINQLKALKLIAITLPVMSRKRMSLLIKNCFSLVKIPKINIYEIENGKSMFSFWINCVCPQKIKYIYICIYIYIYIYIYFRKNR